MHQRHQSRLTMRISCLYRQRWAVGWKAADAKNLTYYSSCFEDFQCIRNISELQITSLRWGSGVVRRKDRVWQQRKRALARLPRNSRPCGAWTPRKLITGHRARPARPDQTIVGWMDGWMDTWSCIHAQRCCRCCFDFWHLGDEANALKRRNSPMKRKPEKARTVREDVGCGENSPGRESMVTLIYCSQYSSEASDAFRYIFQGLRTHTITTNRHFTTHFRNNPLSHCRKSCMNVFFSH